MEFVKFKFSYSMIYYIFYTIVSNDFSPLHKSPRNSVMNELITDISEVISKLASTYSNIKYNHILQLEYRV